MVEANLTSTHEVADAPREADQPRESLIAHFGADKPLKLDAGVELSPIPDCLQDLWHAQLLRDPMQC